MRWVTRAPWGCGWDIRLVTLRLTSLLCRRTWLPWRTDCSVETTIGGISSAVSSLRLSLLLRSGGVQHNGYRMKAPMTPNLSFQHRLARTPYHQCQACTRPRLISSSPAISTTALRPQNPHRTPMSPGRNPAAIHTPNTTIRSSSRPTNSSARCKPEGHVTVSKKHLSISHPRTSIPTKRAGPPMPSRPKTMKTEAVGIGQNTAGPAGATACSISTCHRGSGQGTRQRE